VSLDLEEIILRIFWSSLPLNLFEGKGTGIDAGFEDSKGEKLRKGGDIGH
jgi:hypothetical protein